MKVNTTSFFEFVEGVKGFCWDEKHQYYYSSHSFAFAIDRGLLQLNLPFIVVEPALQLTTYSR